MIASSTTMRGLARGPRSWRNLRERRRSCMHHLAALAGTGWRQRCDWAMAPEKTNSRSSLKSLPQRMRMCSRQKNTEGKPTRQRRS